MNVKDYVIEYLPWSFINREYKEYKLNREKKEQMKQQEIIKESDIYSAKAYGPNYRTITTSDNLGNSISTTVCGAAFIPGELIPTAYMNLPKIQEKTNMYVQEDDVHYTARKRLMNRTYDARNEHYTKLRQHYHMDDHDTSDWSYEDFVKAIKNGMFVYRDEKRAKSKGSFNIYNVYSELRFRDPNKEPDKDGFNASSKKVQDAYENVIDTIAIDEPTKARKEFDKFRETTFH